MSHIKNCFWCIFTKFNISTPTLALALALTLARALAPAQAQAPALALALAFFFVVVDFCLLFLFLHGFHRFHRLDGRRLLRRFHSLRRKVFFFREVIR